MKNIGLLGTSAFRSIAFFGLAAALATPAFAQEDTDAPDAPETLQSETELESGRPRSLRTDPRRRFARPRRPSPADSVVLRRGYTI